jgi:hypothetical protein
MKDVGEFQTEELLRALESLTPGGSEFHNSPGTCINWIQWKLGTVVKQVQKRKEAEAEKERLLSVCSAVLDDLNEIGTVSTVTRMWLEKAVSGTEK